MVGVTRKPEGSEDSGYGSVSSAGSQISIERWIAGKDKFRVSADGQIPLLWRSKSLPVSVEVKDAYNSLVSPQIPAILARYELSFVGERLHRLQPLDGAYETRDVIGISTRDERPGRAWRDAVNEVLSLVKENIPDSQSIQILLVNTDRMYDDVSSALPNAPSIVGPLEQVKSRIVEEVEISMSDLRPSIAFHMRRRRNDFSASRKPTVIIFCHPHSVSDFPAVEEKILNILNELDIAVFLEILPGKLVLTNPGFILRRMRISPEELPEHPVNGSSIGVKGRGDSAGTLGGWLILNLPREKRQIKCALTCYHVVRSNDPSVTAHTDAHGIHWNDKRGRLSIEYPASLDTQIAMARLDELRQFHPDDQQLRQQQRMLSELVAGPGIGKVLLASGHQVRDNHRLNWALIESPETFSSNRPPSTRQGSFALPTSGPLYRPHPDAKITQFAIPKEDNWVVRTGRTTIASASISSMKKVEWPSGFFTQEIELVSEDDDVADEGDSGSFVVNREGNLVGMIFAVYRSPSRFHTAYMMTFDSIQSHVKDMTDGGFLSFD
ncbi:hypothetical protein TEQG_06978 [Trichophyton equinum CBS 127.97]|uniref:Uncharacterized protein n=1 Tax=Trichophyton equinum (strain ATCC MYA-4606 / CBS 127.97) TaxID=559882 RepID=F2Q1H3_TRIEC|nr:hypothetical protein TEQG_06978 [Trichophyton equinum CBS 127.97]